MKNLWKYQILVFVCLCLPVCLSGCAEKEEFSLEAALLKQESIAFLEKSGDTEAMESFQEEETWIYVYVCGAVADPGVYVLPKDSRVVAAVEAAGGFLEDASLESVNLAAVLSDGQQITIPDQQQALQAVQESEADGRVNLNRATLEQLCTLSGIGESKAKAILAYREEIGAFTSIEQLQNVTGIGEKLFQQIEENIYIE